MGASLEEEVFLGHVMVSQHLPMVRGEDHPGIPEQIVFPQGAEDAAQLIVCLGDARIVSPPDVPDLFGAQEMHVRVFVGA